jgi:hypothetical protein
MIDINQLIKDSFDVISLILVFVFVLFDLRYPQIMEELKKELPPKDRKLERDKQKEKLKQVLLVSNAPLIVIYGFLFYLFLPLLFRVRSESRISLWQFDFVRTAFVFIVALIFGFLIWSIKLAVQMVIKILKYNK